MLQASSNDRYLGLLCMLCLIDSGRRLTCTFLTRSCMAALKRRNSLAPSRTSARQNRWRLTGLTHRWVSSSRAACMATFISTCLRQRLETRRLLKSEVRSPLALWVSQGRWGGRTALHDAKEAIRLRVLQRAGGSCILSKYLRVIVVRTMGRCGHLAQGVAPSTIPCRPFS